MKTQINFSNVLLLSLSLCATTLVWGNSEATVTNSNNETTTIAPSGEQLPGGTFMTNNINLGLFEEEFMGGVTSLTVNPLPDDKSTEIVYELEMASNVDVNVFNGQELVTRLYSGYQESGTHSIIWDVSELPAGVYSVVLVTEGGTYNASMQH